VRRTRCTLVLDGPPPAGRLEGLAQVSVRAVGQTVVVAGVVRDQETVVSTMVWLEALGTRVLALRIDPYDDDPAPEPAQGVPAGSRALRDLRP
jgi:hypothetical protein